MSKKQYELLDQAMDLYFDDKVEDSLALFTQILEDPHTDTTTLAKAYRYKGNCYNKLEQYQNALMQFNKALELVSKDDVFTHLWTLANKGWCLYKLNRHQEALVYYKEAIQLTDNKDDLETLQMDCEIIMEDYRWKKEDEEVEEQKQDFVKVLIDKIESINQEEFERDPAEAFKGKPMLKA
jgi:tetratricopeptide (TPR) repeat protein